MIHMADQNFLSSFNVEFNGIDESKLRDLVTGEFIQRAENLLLIGGDGSGKSAIAHQIENAAASLGLRTHLLADDYQPFLSSYFLEVPERLGEREPIFRSELLNADLLIVDEAQRWLEVAPHEFTYLICQRIAMGKSHIFLVPSHGWKRSVKQAKYRTSSDSRAALGAIRLMASMSRTRWAETIVRCETMSFEMQMQILGIGFTNWDDPRNNYLFDLLSVPNTPEAHALKTEFDLAPFTWCNQSITEWLQGPGWKPVWQILYTGADNYRRLLER